MASAQKQNVVVIGGGISGVTVAQGLTKKLDHAKFNLIVIEPRPHHIWLPAVARMVVTSDKNFAKSAILPFDTLFPRGRVVVKRDKVLSIQEGKGGGAGELKLASGETLTYRGQYPRCRLRISYSNTRFVTPALVLATGSKWSGPIDLPESEAGLRQVASQWRERFEAAEDIIIVGGGAVGVELSGEIRDEYPVYRLSPMCRFPTLKSSFRKRRSRLYTLGITC